MRAGIAAMNKDTLPMGLIACGMLVILCSLFIPRLMSGRLAWSDHKAGLFQRASQNYHDALHLHPGQAAGNRGDEAAALEAARNEYVKHKAAFDGVTKRGASNAFIIRCLGIVGVLAGLLMRVVQFAKS